MKTRSTASELMDTEKVTQADFATCLADLSTVNTLTLARLPTLAFIRRIARRHPGRTLRVLDVGCGEGDMLRRLHRWSTRAGRTLELTGLDLNPLGIAAARAATPSTIPITFQTGDIFDPALGRYDVIISSLFTHHLTDPQLAAFLRVMETHADLGWFINDLHRHPIAYHGFRLLSRAAGWHRFVQHDGAVSVARSFTRAEWQRALHRALLDRVTDIRWQTPFRICISRFK